MVKFVLLLLTALVPAGFALWLVQRSKRRFQMRMRRIRQLTYVETLTSESLLIDGRERFIGELSCRYNAHSPYLRCAVNPDGPCENCSYYEKVSEDSP